MDTGHSDLYRIRYAPLLKSHLGIRPLFFSNYPRTILYLYNSDIYFIISITLSYINDQLA